ncbi:BQ2448_4870 [Microbotryum intermedium]|uniref:BQ2448_4870 protein n=1 Tax=Microbotryum intermedium TaxID=269621 RepID=A0A238FM67_9BASI|nr:BQ2448_4870 [Microbotryum intermedium]
MPSTRVRQPSAKARAAAGEASPVSSSTPVASTSKATTASTSTGSRSRTAASGTSSTSNSTEAATRKSARGRGKGNKAATATTDETLSKKGRANDDDDDNDNDAEQDDAPSDLEETHQMSVDEDENVDGDDQDDTYDDHMGMSNSKEPDFTLYCICLGLAGEQPMIQCDHCSNWFHFSCVGIDDDTAAMIESYCCDICAGMGKGVTSRSSIVPRFPFGLPTLSSPRMCGVAQLVAPPIGLRTSQTAARSADGLRPPHGRRT